MMNPIGKTRAFMHTLVHGNCASIPNSSIRQPVSYSQVGTASIEDLIIKV